jgi:rfaE bifunctional protein nucleotidyltransferase chain/domain
MTPEFYEKYKFKIKTLNELKGIVGPFPRDKKIIMCHGVFDVVHPGHVHHLAFAKSKGDILVVSITSDRHIRKGTYRPYVPEHLRALNLAAFEMVDYVIIDEEATPIRNLREIKPDYFAKGFEYVDGQLPPKTQEEMDIITEYGGEMVFTPGDVVFSSSRLIDISRPPIRMEKLLSLMYSEDLTFDRLREVISSLRGYKVHVVGDLIIDTYTETSVIGSKAKTPTMSVRYLGQTDYVGGAGIVSCHLNAAGADVTLTTTMGDDSLRDWATEQLKKAGVRLNVIIDSSRPTTHKNVIIADGYRLLKIDTLGNQVISTSILKQFEEKISGVEADAVAFCDFRHGIFNRDTVPGLTRAIPKGVFKVADSQVASRWGNITEFVGFDLITPNENEARFALGDQDSVVGSLCSQLMVKSKCNMLMLKMGKMGVITSRLRGEIIEGEIKDNHYFSVDPCTDRVLDPVGAGDALLAYATLSMLATNDEVIATILGSMAAACECEQDGNLPITPELVIAKIDETEKASKGL